MALLQAGSSQIPIFDRLFRDRVDAFACLGTLDALNGFAVRVILSWQKYGLVRSVLLLGGVSAVCWFALFIIGSIAREDKEREPFARFDALVLAAMAAGALLPLPVFASVALLAGSAYLVQTSPVGARTRRIAIIMLAMTGTLIWGRLLITMIPAPILDFDAAMAGALVGAKVSGNVVLNLGPNGGAGGIIVMGGCSSFHNMSLAVLLYATLMSAFSLRPTTRLVAAGAMAVLAMAAINILRLAAMVRFPSHFQELHDGLGADLFGLSSLLCAGLIIGIAVATMPRAAGRAMRDGHPVL